MEQRKAQIDSQKWDNIVRCANTGNSLVSVLASYSIYRFDPTRSQRLLDEYHKFCPDSTSPGSVQEFFCPELKKAFTALAGKEMAQKVPELLALRLEGQYSSSPCRRSFRSRFIRYYESELLLFLCSLIGQSCYTESIKERLSYTNPYGYSNDYEYLLALEIRRGSKEIISAIREALFGDNSQLALTREMIRAIIISNEPSLLDDLLRLLSAAKQQEGLRQQILENADLGQPDVLIRILKFCLDEDLFRFSSTIRAFDTWTGMACGDQKPAAVKKYAQCAYNCLTSEECRQKYAASEDNTEAYFALWAQGCHELDESDRLAQKLLSDPKHYRRVLGWFYISHTDNSLFRMNTAAKHLDERDKELLAWVVLNLSKTWQLLSPTPNDNDKNLPVTNPDFPENKADRYRLFCSLKETALYIGNKKRIFSGNPFEHVSVSLSAEPVYNCMISLAGYDMDKTMIEELLELAPGMSSDQRQALLHHFIEPKKNPRHYGFLYDMLNDRSVSVKETAVKYLSSCKLSENDLRRLADALRSKSSSLRKNILSVFYKQDYRLLSPVLSEMLESTEEYQNQAAIEMITTLNAAHPHLLTDNYGRLTALRQRGLSTQTQILLDQILTKETEEKAYTPENGYGLYDPATVTSFITNLKQNAPVLEKQGFFGSLFSKKSPDSTLWSAQEIKKLFPSETDIDILLNRINQVFERHADYEYEVVCYDSSHTARLFGDIPEYSFFSSFSLPAATGLYTLSDPKARLEMLPFCEEFLEAFGDYTRDVRKMLGLYYAAANNPGPLSPQSHMICEPWFAPIAAKNLSPWMRNDLRSKPPRYSWMLDMIEKLPYLFDSETVFREALKLYQSMIAVIGEKNLDRNVYMLNPNSRFAFMISQEFSFPAINHPMLLTWRKLINRLELSSDDFSQWFFFEYLLEKQINKDIAEKLNTLAYFKACNENLIPQEIILDYLLTASSSPEHAIGRLTNPNRFSDVRKLYTDCPWAASLVHRMIDRMVEVEQKRGEMSTPLTGKVLEIHRFEGAHHFRNLLAALGKESFHRGYVYSNNCTKKEVLSQLLKRCYPSENDSPEKLKLLLQNTDISDKRLAEAAMYAPQWAGFAEDILGWPGLKCGVWFFHAHINETFSAEKETETAIYSPISPQQFNDGAFDQDWFFRAYNQLGEKRFQILYKAAKYITSGSNQHRRSQLYADAVLGKLSAKELETEILEKRSQEKLRCYPLIPIADSERREALHRYEFIQKFLKESRQFGSQRKESEKKACATAMENLAITTGLMDVNRLMWQMETAKLEEIRPLMEPTELDGVSVRLTIDQNGDAGIAVEKNGKTIKTAPKSLSKNESFLELKAIVKELKEQKRRSKESLERAMMDSTVFSTDELLNILRNPVLSPMICKLLWISGDIIGFPLPDNILPSSAVTLVSLDGSQSIISDSLRLAHPHDLRAAGVWADFMHLMYEKKWVQPFKQIFREYYPITEDERKEHTISRRYAGHQVQPKRTVALLKSRGWTVDYETGLQKVFYKENLIVRVFALADWFSPADIEAPTLETVEFFDRNTGENVPLEQVPPILFSETMRDLDLVVSVAHVGGVDPEASHSTVEMRIAIASELVQLLKLPNVSWIGSHAKIRGTLASYSVHMGSGVVHAEGIGAIAILPVHSQARGRIFLPFADDDPKTAEIMSKIILLSEDRKIKDPSILQQIKI